MQVERVLAEIKSVRQKYSQAIFELERCKDNVKKLETDKELVSKILKEARDKIDLLESENEKLRNEIANCTSKQTNTVAKKTPREVRSLLAHNSVLEARLKQAEFGVRQKKHSEEMTRIAQTRKKILKSKKYWRTKFHVEKNHF